MNEWSRSLSRPKKSNQRPTEASAWSPWGSFIASAPGLFFFLFFTNISFSFSFFFLFFWTFIPPTTCAPVVGGGGHASPILNGRDASGHQSTLLGFSLSLSLSFWVKKRSTVYVAEVGEGVVARWPLRRDFFTGLLPSFVLFCFLRS